MNSRRFAFRILPFVLCLFALVTLVLLDDNPALAKARTRYVATTGTDDGACTNRKKPCRTVQYAVDVSSDGDVIKIAGGTYTGVESRPSPPDYNGPAMITQVVYIDKTVTIRGGYAMAFSDPPDPDANLTTLDAQGQGRVLFIAGEISPTIEGLSLTGGNANGLAGWGQSWDGGGGVYILTAGVTLRNNVVYGNVALGGGGLYLVYSDTTLDGNTVTANTANWSGGGLYLVYSDAILTGNTVHDNDAGEFDGGGLVLSHSAATLSDNTVSSNSANNGAGLYLSSSDAILNGNMIHGNTAVDGGGGLLLYGSEALLSGNTIEGNTAGGYWGSGGGGLFLRSGAPTLTNNVFAGNHTEVSGSALYLRASSPVLLHNTIADNTGGDGSGVYVTDDGTTYTNAALTNTILVNHTVGINVTSGSMANLETTLWNGNTTDWSGAGVIDHTGDRTGSPAFIDPGAGDYHIGAGSAAIDVGVDAGVRADIDGDVRPQGSGYDIGADEVAAACPQPLTAVSIGGPSEGSVDTAYTFTALVSPSDATEPILYTWSPEPDSGQGTDSTTYSWAETGLKTLSVTAQNCGGTASDEHVISIVERRIHVDSIGMRHQTRGGGTDLILATVAILDQDNQKVNGASVSVQWSLPDSSLQDQQAGTSPAGIARFQVESTQTGTYQICVTDVIKSGWVYDPSQNVETCGTLTLP